MISFIIVITSIFFYISKNEMSNNITLQIIQFDIMDDSEKIVEEVNVRDNDIINLEKFNGNNIKILDINDAYIKISRDAARYEILSQTSLYSGEVREYTETVIEKVNYNALINININSKRPFGPEYVQPRYYYNIKFIK